MKILMSHPTGNQNVRAAALAFAEAGIVTSFNTTIASFPGGIMDRLSNYKPFSMLGRRRFDPRMKEITETSPWLEVGRLFALQARLHSLTQHEHGLFSIDAVYRSLDKRVAEILKLRGNPGITAVYAYEDGARLSFRQAKKMGLECFYDLPIGYWRAAKEILEEEKQRWPAWSDTLIGLQNSQDKLGRKDEELRLADRIFVASKFTADTLKFFPGPLPPVEVIPYGYPPVANEKDYSDLDHGPLKLLFVGGLTQRKGIADLFAVAEELKPFVSLTVVGRKSNSYCRALDIELAKHRWIPSLPHKDILGLMRRHDVLVFPSLFEGFGLVITEAMSQGTPVITTDHTAGPDLIEHGRNGWIIKAGSTEALQNCIEAILETRSMVSECGRAAMATARQRPWEAYGRELAESVRRKRTVGLTCGSKI
jgi:glycosyltransferase involved in cell wall biosynthesis